MRHRLSDTVTPMSHLCLACLAGMLSILSPCVLPLLPIVMATAAAQTRAGPLALAAGLVVSYVATGLFLAVIGFAIGLDGLLFRRVGAIMALLIGLMLMLPRLQAGFAIAAGPVGDWIPRNFGGATGMGPLGQFGVGLMLGAVWSPCVGPILGSAILLASEGRDLTWVSATMLAFGCGAALPLLGLGLLSRQILARWRVALLRTGETLKAALGGVLILSSVSILSGFDKAAEAALTEVSPDWLTALVSRF